MENLKIGPVAALAAAGNVDLAACEDPAQKLFGQMVDATVSRRILPFLGSGVSFDCTIEGDDFKPRVDYLRDLLDRAERQALGSATDPSGGPSKGTVGESNCCGAKRPFQQRAEEFIWRLQETSSQVPRSERDDATLTLCRTIQVDKFARLQPLPAHYALAALAMEGLIEEIITTNWDTNLEQALDVLGRRPIAAHPTATESAGGQADDPTTTAEARTEEAVRQMKGAFTSGRQDCGETHADRSKCYVVVDVADYQQFGALRRTERGRAILRLYKINGCAQRFVNDERSGAESIIVTDRQLHEFGDRRWAQDLLHDRVRSRTLLFSGFGSEEPQVQHTLLRLAEELRTKKQKQADPDTDLAREAAHPRLFITHFFSQLTFAQRQLLRAARNDSELSVPALTGEHAAKFGLNNRELKADAFWPILMEHAIECVLRERYLAPRSAFYAWLSRYVNDPAHQIQSMLDWVFILKGASLQGRPPLARTRLNGLFGPTVEPAEQKASDFKLSRWMEEMDGRPKAKTPPRYIPFRDPDEPLLPLATLMVLFWLARRCGGEEGPIALAELTTSLEGVSDGLRFCWTRNGSEEAIYLITESFAGKRVLPDQRSRLRLEIVVPSVPGPKRGQRITRNEGQVRTLGVCHGIHAGELLGSDPETSLSKLVFSLQGNQGSVRWRMRSL